MTCPSCQGTRIKKNGHIHTGKQNFRCKTCGRQFVADKVKKEISTREKEIVTRLFAERISLRGICRAVNVSLTWVLQFFKEVTDETPADLGITVPPKGKLTLELDEMWSFVKQKTEKEWLWLAIDRGSKQIVGWHSGGRSEADAKRLWASLPGVYRQCAVCYSDFWAAYAKVVPSTRHRPVGKETGETSHIERTNGTFRQRISRLVRKTLSFSKSRQNHHRAIKYFIWCFNIGA